MPASVICIRCLGQEWVCEAHPNKPWGTGTVHDCSCGEPGMPCDHFIAQYEKENSR